MDEEPQPSTSTGLNVGSRRIRKPNQKYRNDYISDISEELPRKINKNCEKNESNFSEESETPPEIGSILRKGIKFTDSEECLEFMKDDSVEEAAVQTELENETDLENNEELDLDFNLSDLEDENSDNELDNNETIFEEPDDSYEPIPSQNLPVPNPQVPLIIQTGFAKVEWKHITFGDNAETLGRALLAAGHIRKVRELRTPGKLPEIVAESVL